MGEFHTLFGIYLCNDHHALCLLVHPHIYIVIVTQYQQNAWPNDAR